MEFLDDSEWSGEDEDSDFEEDLLKDKGEEEELQMMRTAMKKRISGNQFKTGQANIEKLQTYFIKDALSNNDCNRFFQNNPKSLNL